MIEEVCKEHVEVPVPVEVPYPVPVPKPVEVPVYKDKIIEVPKTVEVPVYKEKIIEVYKPEYHPPPAYTPPPTPPPPPAYHPPTPPAPHAYAPPKPDYGVPLAPPTSVPAVPHPAPHPPTPTPHPVLPHHHDPHHPSIPHHEHLQDPTPLPTFTPPKHHGPHIHHDLQPPDSHAPPDSQFVTALPNLDPLKASIVDKFNKQLIRSKRDSKSDPEAEPFPDPEAEAEATALAIAEAIAEAHPESRHSIHDLSIEELQELLHSINGRKLINKPQPQRPALGEHVLDLSRFEGASPLAAGHLDTHGVQLQTPHNNNKQVLGGDFLGDPVLRAKLRLSSQSPGVDALTLLGPEPTGSVLRFQSEGSLVNKLFNNNPSPPQQSFVSKPQNILSSGSPSLLSTIQNIDNVGHGPDHSSQLQLDKTFVRMGKQNTNFLSDDQIDAINEKFRNQASSNNNLDMIFKNTGAGVSDELELGRRQVSSVEVSDPPLLGGRLTASQLTDDIVARVMEHLRNNKPKFQLQTAPEPAIPPILPPVPDLGLGDLPPPLPPPDLHPHPHAPGGQLGGVLVPPHDHNIINDHFPLPVNPLPPHFEQHHPLSHHQTIQDALHHHKQKIHHDVHHAHHPPPDHHLDYDPHVELHVKPNPPHHNHYEPPHLDHYEPAEEPVKHPEPVVTKTEIEAPPGCKAYSTRTCKKIPIVVPEKVPVPRCYDVPKVECFHVLSPAPDLSCAPKAVEECMDTVKEVPYLYPTDKCYDVPREECRDITEQVPVVVCTQIDRTRVPKATLVSRPYGRFVN